MTARVFQPTHLSLPACSYQGDKESQNGLGIIYRDGLGVKQDIKQAVLHFKIGAGYENAESDVQLAKLSLGKWSRTYRTLDLSPYSTY